MADHEAEARMDRMDARIASLVAVSENLAAVAREHNGDIKRHDGEIAELRAMMNALIKAIDRFIQGRGGNGQK